MIQKPQYFGLEELVCPHVYYKYGQMAWQFLDQKQLILMDWVRTKLGPIYVNNWYDQYKDSDFIKFIADKASHSQPILEADLPKAPAGLLDEMGLRCNLCSLYTEKTKKGIIYVSPHGLGKGDDYQNQGRVPEEVRQYLILHQKELPYPIRLEKGVSWVHMDCEDTGEKVQLFNP